MSIDKRISYRFGFQGGGADRGGWGPGVGSGQTSGGSNGGGNPNQDRANEAARAAAAANAQAAANREAARSRQAIVSKTYASPNIHEDTGEEAYEMAMGVKVPVSGIGVKGIDPREDPERYFETVVPETLPKGHPDRIKEEVEEAIKQLSTKAGTKEALREFKALKTRRQYVPDVGLLERLGIKKPEGILGSLVDTGEKYFDPKKMAMNFAMKKLGLSWLNPFLGIASLFGFDPYKSLTNKFAKKPAFDVDAASKLGLYDKGVTTPTDTRTAKRARDNFEPSLKENVIAKNIAKFTGGNKLAAHGGRIDRPLMGRNRYI